MWAKVGKIFISVIEIIWQFGVQTLLLQDKTRKNEISRPTCGR
jgi:hypothetical protein